MTGADTPSSRAHRVVDESPPPTVTLRFVVLLCLCLSVVAMLLGSVRFGRHDWTGLTLEQQPVTDVRVVSDECIERIRPYVADDGRVIGPISVDQQQYLSMVDLYRGTPRSELQANCLLGPFVDRAAVPWLAAQLPFDQGEAVAIVNLLFFLVAVWATVFAVRARGASRRALVLVGILFVVNWNTLLFSSSLLLDVAAVGVIALAWLLIVLGRPAPVVLLLLVSYPVKETVPVVVLLVFGAFLADGVRRGARTRANGAAWMVAASCAAACSFLSIRALLDTDATWQVAPTLGALAHNFLTPTSLATLAIASIPLFLPAMLELAARRRVEPLRAVMTEPAAVGVAATVGLCVWVSLSADLSPRFVWVGFPFAATLAAAWIDGGGGSRLVATLRRGAGRGRRRSGRRLGAAT